MCHGHPRYHSCSHTSMKWYYCPSAHIDLKTGYEAPCGNVSLAPAQSSAVACPLQSCYFDEKGGKWMCCQCGQGPNTQGWCANTQTLLGGGDNSYVTCDHGCCRACTKLDGWFTEIGSPISSGTSSSYGSYESDMRLSSSNTRSSPKSKGKPREDE